jgi:hypothetical protein
MTERWSAHDGIRGPVIALFTHPPRSTTMTNRVSTILLSLCLATTATLVGCDSKSDAKPDDKKVDAKDAKKPDAPVDVKAPAGDVKAPAGDVKAPAGDVKAPEGDMKAPEGGTPAGDAKAPEGGAPAGDVKAPEGGAPAGDAKAPAAEPTK